MGEKLKITMKMSDSVVEPHPTNFLNVDPARIRQADFIGRLPHFERRNNLNLKIEC